MGPKSRHAGSCASAPQDMKIWVFSRQETGTAHRHPLLRHRDHGDRRHPGQVPLSRRRSVASPRENPGRISAPCRHRPDMRETQRNGSNQRLESKAASRASRQPLRAKGSPRGHDVEICLARRAGLRPHGRGPQNIRTKLRSRNPCAGSRQGSPERRRLGRSVPRSGPREESAPGGSLSPHPIPACYQLTVRPRPICSSGPPPRPSRSCAARSRSNDCTT